jgi:tRNA-dihydrouridine synthase 3
MSTFAASLSGAVIMAPMTKGSNLPYRQLCAKILVSEMVVARRLKQRRRGEFALIRRAPEEPCFGVQLAGNKPDEVAWAAALVEARGADFVDLNLGCPIDHFTRMGLGAALGRQPTRVRRIVEAMRQAVKVPVTVKIRLGWNDAHRNYLDLARAIVDGGADAITVHGRTREARYRTAADWDAIRDVAMAVPVPVIGNGDLLFPHEVAEHFRESGCAATMTARGVLIKPWLFRELTTGYWDITAEERVGLYRRYVELATTHWGRRSPVMGDELQAPGDGLQAASDDRATGDGRQAVGAAPEDGPVALDAHGHERLREFLRWHVGFWVRYAPQRPDGSWPTMQQRESSFVPRSPLEALLARNDDAAQDYITDQLISGGPLSDPPHEGSTRIEPEEIQAG